MNSSDTSDLIERLNNTSIYIYKYIVPIFYIIGNMGNIISALIFSRKSWKKNVCVFYFQIYILYTSVYLNCTILTTIFSSGFNIRVQDSSLFICKTYIYVSILFATLCPTVLILASIDRLLISSQNVDTRLYSSKRLAYFSISLGTFFWVVFNSHALFKVNIVEYLPSFWICYYDPSKLYREFISYSLTGANLLFAILMVILSVIASKNIRRIRTVPTQQRNQIRVMKKKDFQLLRCLFAQDIVFIIFKFWIYGFYVYDAVTKDRAKTPLGLAVNNFLDKLFTFLYNVSYTPNFFIFVSISKAFRQEVKQMIYKMIGKDLADVREEDNRQQTVEMNVVVVSHIVTKM